MSPWAALEGMLALAQVLLDLGDGARAAEVIDDAQDVLILYPDDVSALAIRLQRLRHRLARPSRVDCADPLTDREVAVLRLLRGTLSVREIGQELGVSPNTVKTYTRAIYRKFTCPARPMPSNAGATPAFCDGQGPERLSRSFLRDSPRMGEPGRGAAG